MQTNEIKRLLSTLQGLNGSIADLEEQKDYFQSQLDKGIESTTVSTLDPQNMFTYEINYKDVIRQANAKLTEKKEKFSITLDSLEKLSNE